MTLDLEYREGTRTDFDLGMLGGVKMDYDRLVFRRYHVDSVGKPMNETNLYMYASDNPVNFVDPLGLQSSNTSGGSTTSEGSQGGCNKNKKDCLNGFFNCLGETVLGPGWSTFAMAGGQTVGEVSTALAWQHAASNSLTYPLRSSIVRNYLAVGTKAFPLVTWGSIIIAEGFCLAEEIKCVNGQ